MLSVKRKKQGVAGHIGRKMTQIVGDSWRNSVRKERFGKDTLSEFHFSLVQRSKSKIRFTALRNLFLVPHYQANGARAVASCRS